VYMRPSPRAKLLMVRTAGCKHNSLCLQQLTMPFFCELQAGSMFPICFM
jgi:hypothetical protein